MWMIGIFGAAIALAVGRFLLRGANAATWAQQARHTGDLTLLIEHIEKTAPGDRATEWDQAIGSLWQSYHRETAARLVVEGAKRSEAPVIQYWIRQFLEIEPALAEEHFSEEFLAAYFRPEVAAKCGKSCGCG